MKMKQDSVSIRVYIKIYKVERMWCNGVRESSAARGIVLNMIRVQRTKNTKMSIEWWITHHFKRLRKCSNRKTIEGLPLPYIENPITELEDLSIFEMNFLQKFLDVNSLLNLDKNCRENLFSGCLFTTERASRPLSKVLFSPDCIMWASFWENQSKSGSQGIHPAGNRKIK
jgi:hypothetical protein